MEMESHRITKKIFTWDFEQRRYIGNSTLNIVELYNNLLEVELKLVKETLHENEKVGCRYYANTKVMN